MKEIMRFVVSVQAMQDFHKSAIMRNPVKLDSVYVLEEMETGNVSICGRQESIADTIGVSQQAVSLAFKKGRKEIRGWHVEKKPKVYMALSYGGIILLCRGKKGELYTMDGESYIVEEASKDSEIDISVPFYENKWDKIMEQAMPSEVDDK